jgi:hypothetical protein
VDVTRVAPGRHQLRAVVNPDGAIDETRTDNNSLTVTRVIPGVTAEPRRVTVDGSDAARVVLAGTIVAPGIPGVRDPRQCNAWKSARCYVHATRSSPLHFVVPRLPQHGELTVLRPGSRREVVSYTPDAGFHGVDTFAYTAADPRGLVSAPATVRITVS